MIANPISSLDTQARAIAALSEEKMVQFLKIMERWETVDWKTVKNIASTAIYEYEDKAYVLEVCKQYEHTEKKPKDIPGLDYLLLDAVPNTFKMADKTIGPSGIGSIVFETRNITDEWKYYNPDLLIMGYNEGNFGRWSGNPRTGKTNGSCVLMERWIDKGRIVLTNIAPKEETNKFVWTKDARDLFEKLTTIQRQTKWIFIYDEGGLTDSKSHASTLHARYMNDIYRIIGKTWGNALYIDQLYTKCPEAIETFSTNIYHSIEKGVVYFELNGKDINDENVEFRKVLTDFPKTSIPYEHRDWAYFDSKNLNAEAMFAAVSGIINEKERYDAMHDFLESPESYPGYKVPKPKKEKPETDLKEEIEENLKDWTG